jgi:phage terminase large subunit-like protein
VSESCPVGLYARAVLSGEISAGRLVRLACQRHLNDLDNGHERGLYFDHAAADFAYQFFSHLRLPVSGETDGKPFELEPFQKFIVGSLFGWKGEDGYRRFRTAYVEIGKGNGKSPLAGGIGLFGLVADGELGAEVYSGATTAFQAGILFRDAKQMAESSPALRSRLTISQHNIAYEKAHAFFRPVSGEHRQLSGPRPHMALIDEVHEHPTPDVVDKLRAGTKTRRQALIFEITNSGHDQTTVCWAHHDYSMKVLEGIVQDDSWFGYVCQLDPCGKHAAEGLIQPADNCPDCDNWTDETVWVKANPGIDTILHRKYLREQVREARGMPSKEGIVMRLNFCLWTRGAVKAVPMDAWDACRRDIDRAALAKKPCLAGLDIGSTSDFTALVLLFPADDATEVDIVQEVNGREEKRRIVRRSYTQLPFFWLPETPVRRDERTEQLIHTWRRAGLVKTTPGEVVDYDQVLEDIAALAVEFDIQEFAIDRGFQGAAITTGLQNRFGAEKVFAIAQGILSMNAPFREYLELLKQRRLFHDGNPVLRWMASNTASESKGGLIKPSKEMSPEKIDGLTAGVMAMARGCVYRPKVNPYETGGLFGV